MEDEEDKFNTSKKFSPNVYGPYSSLLRIVCYFKLLLFAHSNSAHSYSANLKELRAFYSLFMIRVFWHSDQFIVK